MTDETMRGRGLALALCLHFSACDAPPKTTVVVFAASSLTDAFGDLEHDFEAQHPEVDVLVSFAGSQVLRHQIEQGAPVDVFASANLEHVEALAKAGLLLPDPHGSPFADNELVVVVPASNPSAIATLRDLPRAERLVLGTPAVPVGAYARQLLTDAETAYGDSFSEGVLDGLVSEEPSVRLVRAKVELGEADAAIVYRSDTVGRASTLEVIALPESLSRSTPYGVGVATRTSTEGQGAKFVDYLHSKPAQQILERRGFGIP